MDSDVTVIARKSPGVNAIVSLIMIGLTLAHSVWSIRDGFDTAARPWMEGRLWVWWLSAYVVGPAFAIMLIVNFWRLARNGFVAISLRHQHLDVFGVTRQGFALEDLRALRVKLASLSFMLKNGREVQLGLLGLVGGTETLVERIKTLKPDIQID